MDASVGRQAVSGRPSLPAFTMSGRTRRPPEHPETPGPLGAPDLSPVRPVSPSFSMGGRYRGGFGTTASPGPGAYSIPPIRSSRAASMSGRTAFRDVAHAAKRSSAASAPLQLAGAKLGQSPSRPATRSSGFGKAARFQPEPALRAAVPGPNAYVPQVGTIGSKVRGSRISGRTPMAHDRFTSRHTPGPTTALPSTAFGRISQAGKASSPSWGFAKSTRFGGGGGGGGGSNGGGGQRHNRSPTSGSQTMVREYRLP